MSSQVTTVSERATLVRADNPGMMTLEGTNTWVMREPGCSSVAVIDPGPLDEAHLSAILEVVGRAGGRVELVLYTHWHLDHTEAIDRFFELTGAPARALDAQWCRAAKPLHDGEHLRVGSLELQVLATPGHTIDSVSLLLPETGELLSGDTVLGRGTTVITHPDGALGPYLDSLNTIRSAIDAGRVSRIFPGHGPVIERPGEVIDYYLAHREERLQQVRDALAAGATNAREVVEAVYSDVDRDLWSFAEMSVHAQLDYLGAGPNTGAANHAPTQV